MKLLGVVTLLVFGCALASVYYSRPGRLSRSGDSPTGHDIPDVRRIDLEVGAKVCRPDGASWPKASRIVVIIGSQTCSVCSATKPFTEMLFDRATTNGIPVFYVLPSRADNDSQANNLRALGRNVLRADLRSFGTVRIPTVLAVTPDGTIVAMWTGSIAEEKNEELLTELISGNTPQLYKRLSKADLRSAALSAKDYEILALDNFQNLPFPNAKYKVIPLRDLTVRSKYELKPSTRLFIDCNTGGSIYVCQEALLTLWTSGFRDLVAVDLPRRTSSDTCEHM